MTDESVVTIQIDGRTHRCSAATFRRLLTTTRHQLAELKRQEGSTFPQVDRAALDLITEIQFRHPVMI